MYDLSARSDLSECVIGEEVILNNEEPLLLYENKNQIKSA